MKKQITLNTLFNVFMNTVYDIMSFKETQRLLNEFTPGFTKDY